MRALAFCRCQSRFSASYSSCLFFLSSSISSVCSFFAAVPSSITTHPRPLCNLALRLFPDVAPTGLRGEKGTKRVAEWLKASSIGVPCVLFIFIIYYILLCSLREIRVALPCPSWRTRLVVTRAQKSRFPLLRTQRNSMVLRALSAIKKAAFLISSFWVHSTSFSPNPPLSDVNVTCVMNSGAAFTDYLF